MPPSLPKPLPHPLHLSASLALLLNLLIRQQSIIHTTIKKEVSNARTKINAKSEKETERTVEGKVLGGEMGARLVELLREVAGHPDTDEETRRGVEGEEFAYWRKLVGVVGCVFPCLLRMLLCTSYPVGRGKREHRAEQGEGDRVGMGCPRVGMGMSWIVLRMGVGCS